jgi:hypothetical protein
LGDRFSLSSGAKGMKRFLLHGLALLVLTNVALADSPGKVAGSPGRAGGGATRRRAQSVRLGREFKLKVGRSVTFERQSLRLRLLSVAGDSRCPLNVACVWAGNAEVLVEVGNRSGKGKTTLRLNTNPSREGAGEGKYGHYSVKLVELSPQPRDGRKIKAGEYTATLLVSLVVVD